MTVQSFQDLKVWQQGIELVELVYQVTSKFPSSEMYGLTSQLRRSSVSIPSNIAEGHGRDSTREYLHHLSFARGSLAELHTELIIAERLNYIPQTLAADLFNRIDSLSRMLRGLQRSLRSKE